MDNSSDDAPNIELCQGKIADNGTHSNADATIACKKVNYPAQAINYLFQHALHGVIYKNLLHLVFQSLPFGSRGIIHLVVLVHDGGTFLVSVLCSAEVALQLVHVLRQSGKHDARTRALLVELFHNIGHTACAQQFFNTVRVHVRLPDVF